MEQLKSENAGEYKRAATRSRKHEKNTPDCKRKSTKIKIRDEENPEFWTVISVLKA